MAKKEISPVIPGLIQHKAMILAAGLGTRMRPVTDETPKPLVEVSGRSLLDRVLDRTVDAGIKECVINLHYMGEKIRQHLKGYKTQKITFSEEDDLLETGGGVKKALPVLGSDPFFAINSDILWLDGTKPTLNRMAKFWDEQKMDVLLLIHPVVDAIGYDGRGDFILDKIGTPRRRTSKEVAPYLFAGVQMIHPRVFDGITDDKFSLNVIYDKALKEGRLACIPHDGKWYHVGTPEGIALAEEALEFGAKASRK